MDSYKKKDNELAIVQAANKSILVDLADQCKDTAQDFKELLVEVDELLGNDVSINSSPPHVYPCPEVVAPTSALTWETVLQSSKRELEAQGLNHRQMTSYDLLSPAEYYSIQQRLNRPLYDRIPWDKWDYIFAFGAGLVGGGLDIFLGTPGFGLQKQMADKSSWIGGQMEKIHNLHPKDAPIDYQGAHFGGGYHRGRTTSHDLFHPLEGIRQFIDGEFRGFYWVDGKQYFIESSVNQFGKSYEKKPIVDAVLAWMIHMFCDFFSSASLPIPGTSYLFGLDNRELRVFVERDLYQKVRFIKEGNKRIPAGINLRHLVLQTIPPTAIEVILRAYTFFRYYKQTVDSDALTQKEAELLAVGHSVCAGFNIGKVILLKDPLLINLPQIVALSRTLIRLVLQEYNRNSSYQKAMRNLRDLSQTQKEYEDLLDKGLSRTMIMQ